MSDLLVEVLAASVLTLLSTALLRSLGAPVTNAAAVAYGIGIAVLGRAAALDHSPFLGLGQFSRLVYAGSAVLLVVGGRLNRWFLRWPITALPLLLLLDECTAQVRTCVNDSWIAEVGTRCAGCFLLLRLAIQDQVGLRYTLCRRILRTLCGTRRGGEVLPSTSSHSRIVRSTDAGDAGGHLRWPPPQGLTSSRRGVTPGSRCYACPATKLAMTASNRARQPARTMTASTPVW